MKDRLDYFGRIDYINDMQRDIYLKLLKWKKSKNRKPLILKGARQVGKTYILQEQFGKNEYENMAYFNFEEDPDLKSIFEGKIAPKEIISKLSIACEQKISPKKTLIILDEIQECPQAVTSLKYFCESAKEYHLVSSGSLLGVKLGQTRSFPVGKVNILELFPMTFLEVLNAFRKNQLAELIRNKKELNELNEKFHNELINNLKLYFYLGGMPEVVQNYIENNDVNEARKTQKEILEGYEADFAKHTSKSNAIKMKSIWDNIPVQLSKENKRFKFTDIKSSARYRDYIEPILLLKNSGYIHLSKKIKKPFLPLESYSEENLIKIFFLDIGLLGAMLDVSAKTIIEGNKLFQWYNGMFTESFVAQELISYGQKNLYYWSRAGEAQAEVDFIVPYNESVYPLDAKAGTNTKAKSLKSYNEKYPSKFLSRTSRNNFKRGRLYFNLPLYAISLFPELIA